MQYVKIFLTRIFEFKETEMLFSSMTFLWIFLPAVIIINFILSIVPFKSDGLRMQSKNMFLLFSSLLFYAWGGIYYLLIMLASICLNFAGGYLINRFADSKSRKRLVLILSVILNLGMLFFFKYFNMLVVVIESFMANPGSISGALSQMIAMEGSGALGIGYIVLPIGISFFTFQSMSYVIDVYTGKAEVQKNIISFALYVSLFPQLIAGPIVKYSDIDLQLNHRKETVDLFLSGQKRFCYGLGKKVLLSNTLAKLADDVWALETDTLGTPLAWLALIAYTLQIYYDFSGYSDMAIGIGRMLGFTFKENFDYPLTSMSVGEFWRRWHISLSSWFKEYVYIPLGGNRRGAGRTYLNLLVVFFLTGIWHGANFTFIVWGLYYAFFQIAERLFLKKLLDKNPLKILNVIYTIFVTLMGFVIFRSTTIPQAISYFKQLFNFSPSGIKFMSHISMQVIIVLIVGILFTGILQRPLRSGYEKIKTRLPVLTVDFACQYAILILSVLTLASGTYNPFIYFQF